MTQSHSKHRIALIGFGTVAQGLCEILEEKRESLRNDHQFDFEIVAVITRSRGCMYNPEGLPLRLLNQEAISTTPFTQHVKDWDTETLIRQSNATVIVELAHTNLQNAEPARTHCHTAFKYGKHIITGNKGPAALYYSELKRMADEHNCAFLNEATVLSGTPVLSLLKYSLPGNRISEIRGILNGTTNYILSEMERGASFDAAFAVADQKGYLEADPSADIDGYDAQAKLAILANIIFNRSLKPTDIKCNGIADITSDDIEQAKSQGKRWKLIASLSIEDDGIVAEVKPEALPLDDPLSQIEGTLNAITFSTDLLGDLTISGPGAGKIETGFSILSDLLTLNKGDFS